MPNPDSPSPRSPTTPTTPEKPLAFATLVLAVLPTPKFNLGQLVITANAHAALSPDDVNSALIRHSRGDWGNVCAEDQQVNERGVREQGMVLSAYQAADGTTFWVITDPGHEVTTVLLPDDY